MEWLLQWPPPLVSIFISLKSIIFTTAKINIQKYVRVWFPLLKIIPQLPNTLRKIQIPPGLPNKTLLDLALLISLSSSVAICLTSLILAFDLYYSFLQCFSLGFSFGWHLLVAQSLLKHPFLKDTFFDPPFPLDCIIYSSHIIFISLSEIIFSMYVYTCVWSLIFSTRRQVPWWQRPGLSKSSFGPTVWYIIKYY